MNLKAEFRVMKLIVLLGFLGFQNPIFSQLSVNCYAELGTNNVSDGVYGNFSGLFSAKFGTFTASTGALLSLSNANPDIFSAYKLSVVNEFQIFNKPVKVGVFYLWKPFSVDLRETNYGVLAGYRAKHFGYQVGLNTRIYSFSNSAKQKFNFPDSVSTTIWEPINLIYKFTYYLELSKKWNFEASVTNFDNYIIEQETNPMIRTKFSYKLNNKLLLYSDLGYQQAGLLNMRVNTFGVFLRGGVIWQIN